MERDLPEMQRFWRAAYVAPGTEWKSKEKVEAEHIETFLPFITEKKKNSQGRYLPRKRPYFPRYMFIHMRDSEEYKVNNVQGICYILPGEIPVNYIDEMRRLSVGEGEILQSKKRRTRWRPGTRLRIQNETNPFFNVDIILNHLTNTRAVGIMRTNDSEQIVNVPISDLALPEDS